jgi:plasmid maintenance system antidote protein VapI
MIDRHRGDSATRAGITDGLAQYEAEFERDPDYVAETLALQVIEQALQLMKDKGISRSELASLMGVSRAYVSKLFNAPPNMTLRSIAQLALALDAQPHAGLRLHEESSSCDSSSTGVRG